MLTKNQFLTYCSRNNIQTVTYFSVYNPISDDDYDSIGFLSNIVREQDSYQHNFDDVFTMATSPNDFYDWYTGIYKYNANAIELAIRRHMRSKCKHLATFVESFQLPF